MKIRRKVLPLEKARLRLAEEKFALRKARFGVELTERELRLNFQIQERTVQENLQQQTRPLMLTEKLCLLSFVEVSADVN